MKFFLTEKKLAAIADEKLEEIIKDSRQLIYEGAGQNAEVQGLPQPTNTRTLQETYETYPWVRAAVDVIVRTVTSAGWSLQPIVKDPDKRQLERGMKFFKNVHPTDTWFEILEDALRDQLVAGNGYIEKVFSGGTLRELHSMDCTKMKIKTDAHGVILGYKQAVDTASPVDFEESEVVHFKMPSKGSRVYGESKLVALAKSITADLHARAYNAAFFKNGARLKGIITFPGATAEQIERNRVYLENIAKKPELSRGDLLFEGDAKYQAVQTSPGELEFQELIKLTRDEVLAVYGVPPSKVALIETGNIGSGSGDSQDRTFQEETIAPIQIKTEDKINKKILVEGLGITDYEFRFNRRIINREKQSKIHSTYLGDGVMTRDEIRAELSLATDESATRSDLLNRVGGITGTVAIIQAVGDGLLDRESAINILVLFLQISKEEASSMLPETIAPADPETLKKIGSTTTIVDTSDLVVELTQKFQRSMNQYFKQLRSRIVDRMSGIKTKNLGEVVKGLAKPYRHRMKIHEYRGNDFLFYEFPEAVKQLTDFDVLSEEIDETEIKALLDRNLIEIAAAAGALTALRLKTRTPAAILPAAFDAAVFKYEIGAELLASIETVSGSLAGFLTKELNDGVKATILEGVQNGDETPALISRVDKALSGAEPFPVKGVVDADGNLIRAATTRTVDHGTRAETIARTETSKVVNEASLDVYKQAGLGEAELILAGTACEICNDFIAANGTIFVIKDARGILPLHHRCRCTWAPVVPA